jgi:hypothetical protein
MLYYRGFIGPPLAPGEFLAQFTLADYQRALRSGIVGLLNGYFVPFLLLGVFGFLASRSPVMKTIFVIAMTFSFMHFIIFPLPEDRYLSLFYVITSLTAITSVPASGTPSPYEARLLQRI